MSLDLRYIKINKLNQIIVKKNYKNECHYLADWTVIFVAKSHCNLIVEFRYTDTH